MQPCRFLRVTAALLLMAMGAVATNAAPLPATLTTDTGTRDMLIADELLEVDTTVGRIRVPAGLVNDIQRQPDSGLHVITTTLGERWTLRPARRPGTVSLLDPATGQPESVALLDIASLTRTDPEPASPTAHRAGVWLDDGTRLLLDPENWTLSLNAADGVTQTLPVSAIESLAREDASPAVPGAKPSPDNDLVRREQMPLTYALTFPGCAPLPWVGTLGRRDLEVTDLHGNRLVFAPARLQRLKGRLGLPKVSESRSPAPDSLGSLSIRTPLGTLLIPEAAIVATVPLTDGMQVTTHFGDRLPTGPARASRKDEDEASAPVEPTVGSAPPASPVAPLPAGWLRFQLEGGHQLTARFADTSLTWQVTGEDSPRLLDNAHITAIHRRGTALTLVDRGGRLWHGTPPKSARVAIQLLLNGLHYTLPWDALRQAGPDDAIDPFGVADGMRRLDGGLFLMGRTRGDGLPDELPPHALTLSPFYLDRHEVTRAEFAAFVDASGYRTDAERSGMLTTWRQPGFPQQPDEPVVWVTWFDAVRFCNWRSVAARLDPCYAIDKQNQVTTLLPTPNGYRLPTEAEWEFAARQGGQDVLYPWGNDSSAATLAASANFQSPPGAPADPWLWTNPVLAFPPDVNGLYGMAGNVWEWCEDWYFEQAYASIHRQRPQDPCVRTGDVNGLTHRVMRGGSFFRNSAELLRSASRGSGPPNASANRVGFRCARHAEPVDAAQ